MHNALTGAVYGLAAAFALFFLVTARGIYRPTEKYSRTESVIATITNAALSALLFAVALQR